MATLTRCPRCNVTLLAAARFRRESECKCPGCFAVFPLEEALAVSSELVHEALDARADAASAVDGGTYALAGGAEPTAGDSGTAIPSFGSGKSRRKSTEDEPMDVEADDEPAPVRRKREPQGSMIGTIIMLVLGGVFGIGGGVVVVKMIRGDKFKIPVAYLEQKWQDMAGWWSGKEDGGGAAPTAKVDPPTPPAPGGKPAMPEINFNFPDTDDVGTSGAAPADTNPFPNLSRPPKPAGTGAAPAGSKPASTKPAATPAGTADAASKAPIPPAALVGAPPATPAEATTALNALTPLVNDAGSTLPANAAASLAASAIARMTDDASDEASQALLLAETNLKAMTAGMAERKQLSQMAEGRFAAPAKEDGGVVVSGVVQKLGQQKKYRTMTILPAHAPTPDKAITIVTNKKWKVQEGKLVSVAGVIVAKPLEQLPGATLPAERVLWAGVVVDHPTDD